MNQITFFNETGEEIKDLPLLEKLMEYAVEHEQVKPVEFNVIFVDNDYIHKLNKEYRGLDRKTDVITFALEDHSDVEYEDIRLLGDIYISLNQAMVQALEYGHSLTRELSFLCVHGFYHLLGYDHQTEEEEKRMFKKQEEVLSGFGIERK